MQNFAAAGRIPQLEEKNYFHYMWSINYWIFSSQFIAKNKQLKPICCMGARHWKPLFPSTHYCQRNVIVSHLEEPQ